MEIEPQSVFLMPHSSIDSLEGFALLAADIFLHLLVRAISYSSENQLKLPIVL